MELLMVAEITWAMASPVCIKISKIRTNRERIKAYFGGDESGREKEFARVQGGKKSCKR